MYGKVNIALLRQQLNADEQSKLDVLLDEA